MKFLVATTSLLLVVAFSGLQQAQAGNTWWPVAKCAPVEDVVEEKVERDNAALGPITKAKDCQDWCVGLEDRDDVLPGSITACLLEWDDVVGEMKCFAYKNDMMGHSRKLQETFDDAPPVDPNAPRTGVDTDVPLPDDGSGHRDDILEGAGCWLRNFQESVEKCARVAGDPHINSFDGKTWGCQNEGEFIISECEDMVKIHGRFEKQHPDHTTSVMRSMAIQIGGDDAPIIQVSLTSPDSRRRTQEQFRNGWGWVGNQWVWVPWNGPTCNFGYHVRGEPVTDIVAELAAQGVNVDVTMVDGLELYFRDHGVSISLTAFGFSSFGCILNAGICVHGATCNPYAYFGLLGTPDGNPDNEWRATDPEWLALPEGQWPAVNYEKGNKFCTDNYCVSDAEKSIMVHDSDLTVDKFDCYEPPPPLNPEDADPVCKECCDHYLPDCEPAYKECIEECHDRWTLCEIFSAPDDLDSCHATACEQAIMEIDLEEYIDNEPMCDTVGFAPPSATSEPTSAPNVAPTAGPTAGPTTAPTEQECTAVSQTASFGDVEVDDNIDEWDTSSSSPDFIHNMNKYGNPENMVAGRFYARYECASNNICIMAKSVPNKPFKDDMTAHYFKNYDVSSDPLTPIDGKYGKVYDDEGFLVAWEACYEVLADAKLDNIEVHSTFCWTKSDTASCKYPASTGYFGNTICMDTSCAPGATPAPVPATGAPNVAPTAGPTGSPTASPVVAPTAGPTGGPTGSPVTDPPAGLSPPSETSEPTATATISFAPTPCYPDEAITVEETDGVASTTPLPDGAVQIASHDAGKSVTIRVSQVWVEGKAKMLAVRFRDDTDTSVCDKNVDVDKDVTESFTATCVEGVAEVSVYITTEYDESFNPSNCAGCDSPDDDTKSFLGAYHLEIDCNPEPCAEETTPTASPIFFPPIEHCPEEVQMVSSVNQLPGDELPIKVVARTDSTVTFQYVNTYGEDLDYVFIEHYGEDRNVPCGKYEGYGSSQVETFTALCMHTTSKTLVNVWVADNAITAGNDAKIPDCCYGPEDYPYPVIQYTFELMCDCDHEIVCDHFCPPETTF